MSVFDNLLDRNWSKVNNVISSDKKLAKESSTGGSLPLHQAVLQGAPLETIEILLEAFPRAAKIADDEGNLPIHILFKSEQPINLDCVVTLLSSYPNSVKDTNKVGDSPLHILILQGKCTIELVEAILNANPNCLKVKNGTGKLPISTALEKGLSPRLLSMFHEKYPNLIKELSREERDALKLAQFQCTVEGSKGKRNSKREIPPDFTLANIESVPRLYSLPVEAMLAVRSHLEPSSPCVFQLILDADTLLDKPCGSVMDKTYNPASGNKHDFFSMATYFWPDPTKPDGLPYIRRDGYTNKVLYIMKFFGFYFTLLAPQLT